MNETFEAIHIDELADNTLLFVDSEAIDIETLRRGTKSDKYIVIVPVYVQPGKTVKDCLYVVPPEHGPDQLQLRGAINLLTRASIRVNKDQEASSILLNAAYRLGKDLQEMQK